MSKLELVSRRELVTWKRVTCEEAKEYVNTHVIWWRPNMTTYSQNPDNDPAWIAEE